MYIYVCMYVCIYISSKRGTAEKRKQKLIIPLIFSIVYMT